MPLMDEGCPIRSIVKRNGSVVAYDRSRIAAAILKAMNAVGCPDPGRAEALARQVEDSLVHTYGVERVPSVEDIQDVVENTLMTEGLTAVARAYIIYRHERARERAGRARVFDVADNVPYRKLYEALRWNVEHACDSVDQLNRLIRDGRFPELVREGDARYETEVSQAAAALLERRDDVRLVIVAGPSASGKTTTTLKLAERLRQSSLALKTLNLDHYFFDLEQHPRDEFGDYDYETPQALDLKLINQHLADLLAGHTVWTPHYDFKTGRRTLNVHEMRLAPQELLLLDSLHGLNEALTRAIPAERKFTLYIETLGQLRTANGTFMRWADNRLLRRMIRDMQHRNSGPLQTLTHWHYVRRSELSHIIPYIKRADYIVNSALPYELPILRAKLFGTIARVVRRYQNDPKRLDAHIRANRVYALLRPLRPVRDDRVVPPTSLLREFIGGGCYPC